LHGGAFRRASKARLERLVSASIQPALPRPPSAQHINPPRLLQGLLDRGHLLLQRRIRASSSEARRRDVARAPEGLQTGFIASSATALIAPGGAQEPGNVAVRVSTVRRILLQEDDEEL